MTLGKKIKTELELAGQNLTYNLCASLTQTLEHTNRCDDWKPAINGTSFFYNPFIFPKKTAEKII